MQPVRIQRRRTKGFNLQADSRAANGLDCISVTRPGRWGNPFDVKVFGRELSLALFGNSVRGVWSPDPVKEESDTICAAAYAAHNAWQRRLGEHPLELVRSELSGHNLACYCDLSQRCHGDILLRIAND